MSSWPTYVLFAPFLLAGLVVVLTFGRFVRRNR